LDEPISLKLLAPLMVRLAANDRRAMTRAIRRTLAMDAHRWIQWSIAGGGWEGGGPPSLPRRPVVKNPPKPVGLGTKVRRLLKRLRPKEGRPKRARKGAGGASAAPRPAPAGYRAPVDTGDYKASWRDEALPDGSGIFYSSPNPPVKAGVIEEGRRPAPIPIAPLAQWVRRKLNVQDPAEAVRVAMAISRKAARTARPGLHVLGRAAPKIREAFEKNLEQELRMKPATPVR